MRKDDFLKGAFVATLCLVLTKILGVIYVIPFYSIVGSRGSVLYGSAYNIYAIFLNLSTMGLPLAISKMVSEYNTLDYQYIKKKTYKLASKFMIITSIVATIILFILAPLLAQNIIKINIYQNTTVPLGALSYSAAEMISGQLMIGGITTVMRVSATAILFVTLISMIRGYLQGMKYISVSSVSQVIEQFVRVVVILIGSYLCVKVFDTSLALAVSVAVFGATAGAIFAFIYLAYKKKQIPEEINYAIKDEEKSITDKFLIKKIITYTVPFIIMELVGTSFQMVDMFTVVRTLTSYGYSVTDASNIMNIVTTLGTKLNVIVMAVANGIVVSLLPSLTSDYVKGNITAVTNKINKTLQIILYITIPMAVGLSLLAEPVWNIFYGESLYGPKVFMVSIFVAVFGSIFTNVMVIMQSLSRYKKMYLSLILGFGFNAIMNMPFMILFHKIGLPMYYGNLVATMIGYLISIVICLSDLKKTFKINYNQTFKDLFLTIIGCLLMGIIILLIKNIIPMNSSSRVVSIAISGVYAIIGCIIYFAFTYKLGMYDRILGFKFQRKKKDNR